MKIETGYFFITDITGYTQFLAHSELDHAKEILDALFDSILENIEAPLIVSNTQGDAIICYAPAHAFHQPAQLLGVMEKTYFDFRRRLEVMKLNTTCDCDACVNMGALDLKIFLHYGQYLEQQIGPKTDLQGSDVILAHLLMKNNVVKKFRLSGYGLLTQTALEAMGIDPAHEGMKEDIENYEHYGPVTAYVYDLRAAWNRERERRRKVVTADNAISFASAFVPVPQWIAWDYATDLDLKRLYNGLESIERTDDNEGREKIGSSFHCHHRLGDIYYSYVDFDPPNYISTEGTGFGVTSAGTIRIVPVEGGSKFEVLNGPPIEDYDDAFVARQQKAAEETVARFAKIINDDIEAGRLDPNQSEANSEKKSKFGRPEVVLGRYANISFIKP